MCLCLTFDLQLGPSPPAVPQSLRKTYRHAACCCRGNPAVTVCRRSAITRFRSESCLRRTGRFILHLLATNPAPILLTGTKDLCWEALCDFLSKSFMHKVTVLHSKDFPSTNDVTLLVIVTVCWLYVKHILSSSLCFDLRVWFLFQTETLHFLSVQSEGH